MVNQLPNHQKETKCCFYLYELLAVWTFFCYPLTWLYASLIDQDKKKTEDFALPSLNLPQHSTVYDNIEGDLFSTSKSNSASVLLQ